METAMNRTEKNATPFTQETNASERVNTLKTLECYLMIIIDVPFLPPTLISPISYDSPNHNGLLPIITGPGKDMP